MDPLSSQMTCVLRLDTQTSGWDKSIHKLFKGIRDVTYTIDATRGLAYISGKISPDIILRIRKAKKHAELIHMDYGHVPPPPLNPFENVPIGFNYQDPRSPPPMFQQPSPMSQYTYYRQNPYTEEPPVAYPYYYYPYYGPDVLYSPPPQLPTRDGVTGESQCRIL
ncbi:unnamed protein product [Arabis nemorensis]|uniref:HMA domain-containing protein n=1 Tax=Arabis nemorensis TaxID=586526 RepID=A0A565C2X5_9BRAS|nr:unnamed protein product [Arabis nemorensis]